MRYILIARAHGVTWEDISMEEVFMGEGAFL